MRQRIQGFITYLLPSLNQSIDIKVAHYNCAVKKLTLELLLGPQVIAVPTLLLATIDGTRMQTGITSKQDKIIIIIVEYHHLCCS